MSRRGRPKMGARTTFSSFSRSPKRLPMTFVRVLFRPCRALSLWRASAVYCSLLHRCAGADRPPAFLERRPGQAGHHRARQGDHRYGEPEIRAAGGAHRHLRPGRHDLGLASHVHPGDLLPGAGPGSGGEEARAEERRAVQDGAVGQPRGDGEALDEGPREDSCRDAHRHDGGRVQAPRSRSGSRPPSIRDGTASTPS